MSCKLDGCFLVSSFFFFVSSFALFSYVLLLHSLSDDFDEN